MVAEGVSGGRLEGRASRAAGRLVLAGYLLYAAFAPHSIAGSWVGLSLVTLGWLARLAAPTAKAGRPAFQRTPLDLPLALFVLWTLLSILFSPEPRLSLSKLPAVGTFLVFYLARATLTRRLAVSLAGLMIVSGVAGVLWGVGELALGRGVVVASVAPDSPLARAGIELEEGDAVWRVGDRRVSSIAEIDEAIRRADAGTRLPLHVISRGEHVVRDQLVVTEEMRRAASPSGLGGAGPTRRFRASGWTRHYETYAELLQMLAQLALGFALASLLRGRVRGRLLWLPAAAFALLALGIALTAMRTALVAFAAGALVTAWRASSAASTPFARRARFAVALAVAAVLCLGAAYVWRTRATGALRLRDDSASMRLAVAGHALSRVPRRPLLGHGMDAFKARWDEWGFPATEKIHTHSTWVQLAFERGLPALLFWLWLAAAFARMLSRSEKMWRDADDTAAHGFTLGALGALAGFLTSSVVNYNFGDSEVALLFWWLMAATVRVSGGESEN